jgi:hypothetical protein
MTRHGYFLILLLLWGQVDDTWPIAAVAQSAPLDDDDGYQAQEWPALEQDALVQPKQAFVGRKPKTAQFPLVHTGVNLATPFARAPLHVFMSLQI